ncbi:MAG: hypothetical protein HYY17_16390 [Planctomycetes bacterium]|nr:hypothetical protein [Planctomycetota bacterium]
MYAASRIGILLATLLGGCAAPLFDETHNGRSVRVDAGRVFTIALPEAGSPPPQVRGDAVRLLEVRRDDGGGRDLFVFRADRPGESTIGISGATGETVPPYVLNVRVWELVDRRLRPHPLFLHGRCFGASTSCRRGR